MDDKVFRGELTTKTWKDHLNRQSFFFLNVLEIWILALCCISLVAFLFKVYLTNCGKRKSNSVSYTGCDHEPPGQSCVLSGKRRASPKCPSGEPGRGCGSRGKSDARFLGLVRLKLRSRRPHQHTFKRPLSIESLCKHAFMQVSMTALGLYVQNTVVKPGRTLTNQGLRSGSDVWML